jgi:hypothetical protein
MVVYVKQEFLSMHAFLSHEENIETNRMYGYDFYMKLHK